MNNAFGSSSWNQRHADWHVYKRTYEPEARHSELHTVGSEHFVECYKQIIRSLLTKSYIMGTWHEESLSSYLSQHKINSNEISFGRLSKSLCATHELLWLRTISCADFKNIIIEFVCWSPLNIILGETSSGPETWPPFERTPTCKTRLQFTDISHR